MKKKLISFILMMAFLTGPAQAAVEGVFPTGHEAMFLTLLNQARSNPCETAQSVGAEPGIPGTVTEDLPGGPCEGLPPVRLNSLLMVSAAELAEGFLNDGWLAGPQDGEDRLFSILDRWGYLAKRTGLLTGIVGFSNYLDPDEAVRILFRTMLTQDLKGEGAKRLLIDPAFEEIGICFDAAVFSYDNRLFNAYFLVFTTAEAEKVSRESLEMGHLVNQARVLPDATARAMGLEVWPAEGGGSLEAMPPLRWNRRLYASVQGHAMDMLDRGFCDPVDPEGRTASDRASDAGFQGDIAGEWVGSIGLCGCDDCGEKIFRLFRRAFLSEWTGPVEDRRILNPSCEVFAVNIATGTSAALGGICGYDVALWAADFGRPPAGNNTETEGASAARFLLSGVIYEDGDGDGLYGLGEGLEGVTVTVSGQAGALTVVTDEAGGFATALTAGEYGISASAAGDSLMDAVVPIGDRDVYVALRAGDIVP